MSCRFDAADKDLAQEQVKSAVAVKPSGQVKQWIARSRRSRMYSRKLYIFLLLFLCRSLLHIYTFLRRAGVHRYKLSSSFL